MKTILITVAGLVLGGCVSHAYIPPADEASTSLPPAACRSCEPTVVHPAFMDRVAVSSTDAALKREAESIAEDGGMHLVPVPTSHLLFRLAKGENANGSCVTISTQYNGRIVQEDTLPYGDQNLFALGLRDFMNRSVRMAHAADLMAAKH